VPLPPVVIEISPSKPDAALVEALLEACRYSATDSTCVPAESFRGEPTAVAVVQWRDATTVRIDVGQRKSQRSGWRTRNLEFRRDDAEVERWRAVGFVVGTLAGEVAGNSSDKPATESVGPAPDETSNPRAPRARQNPAPPELDERASAAWIPTVDAKPEPKPVAYRSWVDLGPLVGLPLSGATLRLGDELRGTLATHRSPVVGMASLRYAEDERNELGLGLSWVGGSLGAGIAPFGVDNPWIPVLSAELVGRILTASTVLDGETDTEQRWVGSFRGGFGLGWLPDGPLGAVIGANVLVTPGKTEFVVSREPVSVGSTRLVTVELGVATRLEFK
jgi:hypothetical protein